MKKKIAVLGSTGSIGTQTLVCCRNLEYEVTVLSANKHTKLLEAQAREFSPRFVVVSDEGAYQDLKIRLADLPVKLLFGVEGLCEAAACGENDIVCNSVVGMVGLQPTLAAIQAKKTVALANKETLVAGGQLVMDAASQNHVKIIPVDSEHSAIFQALQGNDRAALQKIILTASGGPFRGRTAEQLEQVTLEDALKHPNWSMGAKVTIDSSTLMNKGLEFIEAMWLFGLSAEQIEVLVHPQSIVHSAVEYVDGSVMAQMGCPDMVIPIQYALTWPHRMHTQTARLSLADYGQLTFMPPDMETFVCLKHCINAAKRGGLYPCAVNSANEQAVSLFIEGKIKYSDIGLCVGHVLEHFSDQTNQHYTLAQVLETDILVRGLVQEYCQTR